MSAFCVASMVRLSSRKRAIGRNLGGVRVDVAAAAAARARSDASASAGARARRVPSRSRSRARVPARPRSDARVHARAIARLKSHAGRVFDPPHAPGNHLLLAHSLHRHGALDCCRVGNRGTAVSPRSRVAREARDIERGSRFDRLRSPSSRSRCADEIVGFTGAMGLALARTGKRGAAGGDLARGHLDGGSDGEVGGDDGGHFCCCVVCVKRGVCASMTRGPRSRGVLFERR